ncbi:hypothetical protein, partial [Neisseria meningitidis]|uniref:hypothetical protein n=1 Tax=Neisseria meningitidis TaxID=487 RepID=UPI001A7E05CE
DKFLKLKISSFPQKQKTKNSNLKFVIPTKVGIQNAKSKETVLPDKFPYRQTWIPACAGMTIPKPSFPRKWESRTQNLKKPFSR